MRAFVGRRSRADAGEGARDCPCPDRRRPGDGARRLSHDPRVGAGLEIAGEASDGREAVAAARRLRPDVVLMDIILMPNLDGPAATREIVRDAEGAPCMLVPTTFDLDEYDYDALRTGASGFLLKDAPEQLVDAIEVVASGNALLAPTVTKRVISEFAPRPAPRTGLTQGLDDLTARELEVLKLIATGRSNAEIAGELFVSETTVKTHVARVLMKLRLRGRVQAAVFAYDNGLVEPGESERAG